MPSRRKTEIVPNADNAWVWQEAVIACGQETDLKNAYSYKAIT